MAREVQVMAWCDVDMADDQRVPMAASHEVVLDGKAYTLDLCETHEAALYKPFAGVVAHGSAPAPKGAQNRAQRALAAPRPTASGSARVGRPPSDATVALPVGARCLVSGCAVAYDGRSQGALAQHLRTNHDVRVSDLAGDLCPVCGTPHTTGSGLANHVAKAHPDCAPKALDGGILAAWWWASGHGDPHGVVAASGYLPFLPPAA